VEQLDQEIGQLLIRDYKSRERQRNYATSIENEMLTSLFEDSFDIWLNDPCKDKSLGFSLPSTLNEKVFDEWLDRHLDNSKQAAEIFGYSQPIIEDNLAEIANRDNAKRRLSELLRPAARAYYRAKREEIEIFRSIMLGSKEYLSNACTVIGPRNP